MSSKRYAEKIIKEFGLKPGKILDLGAGGGEMLSVFKDHGFEVYGIEVKHSIPDLNVVKGDFNKLPLQYPDNYFDHVIASFTFRFVRKPQAFIDECERVLKPNGVFIFYDTRRLCLRMLDYSRFNHGYYKRYPWYAYYPHSRVLLVGNKIPPLNS